MREPFVGTGLFGVAGFLGGFRDGFFRGPFGFRLGGVQHRILCQAGDRGDGLGVLDAQGLGVSQESRGDPHANVQVLQPKDRVGSLLGGCRNHDLVLSGLIDYVSQ